MDMESDACSSTAKHDVRKGVWDEIKRRQLVRFPRPVHGRIPNFIGSEQACTQLAHTPEFQSAVTVKIHPSLNATHLRFLTLDCGKDLLTPPLPGHEFLYYFLRPQNVPKAKRKLAAEKRGFSRIGEKLGLREIPKVDLVVVATVAVSVEGVRLGKGKGYGEVEYGIMREIGAVTDETPVATIVHDVQVVDSKHLLPTMLQPYDLPVDIICTPTRTIRTNHTLPKPSGVIWEEITDQMMHDIGALKELLELKKSGAI